MKLKERAEAYANKLVSDLCGDSEVWATHGRPDEVKLDAIRKRFSDVIEAAMSEVYSDQ